MCLATKREHSGGLINPSFKRQQRNNKCGSEYACLGHLVNLIPGKEQQVEISNRSVTTIGRSRSCDVILNEPDISTFHAEFHLLQMNVDSFQRNLINVIDKSRNGTFINGNRLVKKDYILKNGDRIVFGKSCSFLFKYASSSFADLENDDGSAGPETHPSKNGDDVFKKPQIGAASSQNSIIGSVPKKTIKTKPVSFFDKYLLGKELGAGHYALVKEAKNKKSGQQVAVKIFHAQQNDDQKKNKQFREETNILMRVHHPNIVNLLDSFVEPISKSQIQKYLVLEKIDDGELFERIVRKTCLRQDESKALFKQLLTGLKYLHEQNIIHRDIKPENILLNITRRENSNQAQLGPWDEDEIDIQVKIADFGLAKFTGEMQFTNTLCGTPSYVAPEVLTKKGYSSKVDLWSGGVILYVCLCGFPPFSDQLGPPSLKEQILQAKYAFYSPYWDKIDDLVLHLISNLLVLNPDERYNIDEAMDHPWFKDLQQQNSVSLELQRLQITDNKVPKTYSELSCL
ncbi:hypothetical protein SKDZ_04G1420 [Saccharomyces kudriavzevii ZP591]|uniref:Dun1p n=1 Tax=Saccharomyces cerevisiae x Saccharomyces kudriavzevii (strain VIN7) TaxID=1095631 RepID=H0GSC2_SACCK|nr:Dun1p [Saccharomyces cerevisiae x Saccharomyces kudriavzevii VIN7]CAI4057507.1 hypothetical protein SKDZ_04G1420 [Saccharomyces kudriavzevii ZP591]